ncbi:NADH-quinone oxidoreductase subunit L [Crenothrix sp.]|uniref:NADH-quinone oxidoreductase subunit L n=1 Tax=Crenothrix sp. TaxID=3100433 RepID=UPI00374DDA54
MLELLVWVPLIPFLGFLILVLTPQKNSPAFAPWIGAGSVGVSGLLVAIIGYQFLHGTMQPYHAMLGSWLAIDDLAIPYGFYLDALSLTMLFVVTGVGFLIHVYSAGFMADDPGVTRFFAYMNLFVAAMLVLVLADNLLLLYLGWEGVGLGSYLLIGFWYEDANNGYAARKAFVITRIGDTAMAIGLFLLFTHLHTLDIQELMLRVTRQWPVGSWLPITAAALLLGSAAGKSAQLPLQTWLPDAMAGPTPVSALIHAATMVTAGVYLIARTHSLFILAPPIQFGVAIIGTLTLLMAGCAALAQTDIKRILAYSTISQIGYMFLALGVGAWSSAIFHLLTHAFFKALLFLAAGAVIFCFHHEHNIFKMGGLRKTMPIAFWSFMIGSAALSALPFTAGFYSKHEILLATFQVSPVLWMAGCLGALITGIYSFRLVFVVFFGAQSHKIETKLGWQMSIPLGVLSILAVFGGMLQIPLASIFPALLNTDIQQSFNAVSVITVAAPVIGLLIAVLFYLTGSFSVQQFANHSLLKPIRLFFLSGWAIDALYDYLFIRPFKAITSLNKNDVIDGVYACIAEFSQNLHRVASASQTGRVRWYASSMVLGTVVIIAIGLLS